MSEVQLGRSQELRNKFETRYAGLIPNFQKILLSDQTWMRNGYWRNAYDQWFHAGIEPEDPVLLKDFQQFTDWKVAQSIVSQLLENNPRTFHIIRRLVIPLPVRLDNCQKYEFKNPPKPATKKQTLRAIAATKEDIDSEMYVLMWEGIRPDDEDWGDLSVDQSRVDKLEQHKAELEKRLKTF